MRRWFTVSLLVFVVLFSYSSFSLSASAHPGRTDANGGHTCRTNCAKWGLKNGQYHYHSGSGSSSSSNSSSKSGNSSSGSSKSSGDTQNSSNISGSKKSAYQSANVSVYYNGSKLTFDQDPITVDNTTLVPMRKIFEALGASVKWDAQSQTVTAKTSNTEIQLTIGSETAYINGTGIKVSPAPIIVDGITMVPLRSVSEALGASVAWDSSTRTISITDKKQ